MKKGVVLLNTSRGALVDTHAVIQALKTKHIGAIGLDVYEEEEMLFYRDLSEDVVGDDQLIRLMYVYAWFDPMSPRAERMRGGYLLSALFPTPTPAGRSLPCLSRPTKASTRRRRLWLLPRRPFAASPTLRGT